MSKRSYIAATLRAVPLMCGVLGIAVSQNETMAGNVSFHAGVDAGFVSAQHKVRKTLRVDTEDKKKALGYLLEAKWRAREAISIASNSDAARAAGVHEVALDRALYSAAMFNSCHAIWQDQLNYYNRVVPSLPSKEEAEALSNEDARALIDRLKTDILDEHQGENILIREQYTLALFLNNNIGHPVNQIEALCQNDRRGGAYVGRSREFLKESKKLLKDVGEFVDRLEQKYLGELKSDPKIVKKNSGIAELNVGATYTQGKGLLGVEFLVGKNFKKPKGSVEKGGGVYYAGLARVGVLIRDRVELYVLGGARINNSSPIVGAGMRVRLKNKLFMKLEYNDHCGKKKYPRYHLLKVGFGCRFG